MASFVKDIPENPGNTAEFLGYSRPTSPYDISASAKTTAVDIQGIGNLLTDAVKGADETIKSVIDNAVTTGVDTRREGYTGALEQLGNVPSANRVADYQPTPGEVSLT